MVSNMRGCDLAWKECCMQQKRCVLSIRMLHFNPSGELAIEVATAG